MGVVAAQVLWFKASKIRLSGAFTINFWTFLVDQRPFLTFKGPP